MLPATVDYILSETAHNSLDFIGYSMGTTLYLASLSERPDLSAKINAGFLLGPTALVGNSTNQIALALAKMADGLEILLHSIGLHEFLPNGVAFKADIFDQVCSRASFVCQQIYAFLIGN